MTTTMPIPMPDNNNGTNRNGPSFPINDTYTALAHDAERYTLYEPEPGGPADAPDVPLTVMWADLTRDTRGARVPIIPG